MYKYILYSFLSVVFFSSQAQEQNISFDYTVDYIFLGGKSEVTDTLTIGYDKTGQYLWTDSAFLAKEIQTAFLNETNSKLISSDLNMIFDAKNLNIIMSFLFNDNEMFLKMDIKQFIPTNEGQKMETVDLLSNKTPAGINIAGGYSSIYEIYPSTSDNDKLEVAFDESFDMDNNRLFSTIIGQILESSGMNSLNIVELPNGLITRIKENKSGNTLLEAINIDVKPKTASFNYSFKITK